MRKKRTFRGILSTLLITALIGGNTVYGGEFTSGTGEVQEDNFTADVFTSNDLTFEEESFEEEVFDEGVFEEEVFSEENAAGEFTDSEENGEETQDIDYIKGRPLTEGEIQEQEAPFSNLRIMGPVAVIEETNENIPAGRSAVFYPTRYDSREKGIITSVKRQDPYGLCWAFSMASVLETSLLKQGLGYYDLSEEHLAYFFSNREDDPLGNSGGDFNSHYVLNAQGVRDYHESGNNYLVSLFLSTWSGMALEKDFPLETNADFTQYIFKEWDPSFAYNKTAVYLDDAIFANYNRNNIDKIKQLIVDYGSASFMLNMNTRYFNANTAAYCYDTSLTDGVNHIMTIVGWDDDYSKSNFKSNSKVTQNGAWIVKNSWGTHWGDQGYCYVSYDDPTISAIMTGTASNAQQYKNNYFYDGSSSGYSEYIYSGDKVANIFKAKAGKDKAEVLGEIVTMTYKENANFSIQIYTEVTDLTNPTSGKAAYATPFLYNQKWSGIDVIDVPDVYIPQGTYYSIVITNNGSSSIKYGIDMPSERTDSWITYYTSENAGQSFRYQNGFWKDVYSERRTMRIKAHTKTVQDYAGIQFDESEITMKHGEKRTLKYTSISDKMPIQKVQYSSSNNSILQVNASTGQVTAVGKGTAVITCSSISNPQIKTQCKITVKENSIGAITAKAITKNRVSLSWKKVNEANGYIIYRKKQGGKIQEYASVNANTLKYTAQKDILFGVNYYYYVGAYINNGGQKVVIAMSEPKNVKTNLDKTTATVRTNKAVYNTVSWKKIVGAQGYYVYRRSGSSSWKKIKTVSNNKYSNYKITDKSVKALATYQYMVRAYCKVNGKILQGPYQCSGKLITSPAKQSIKSITSASNGLKLTWNPQKTCTGYVIYRKTNTGNYKKIAQIKKGNANTYIDKTAKKGVKYTYCIKAYTKEFYGTVYSDYTRKTAVRK